jgi:5-methylcytosine-specific restriction endonuclease McrA
MAARPKIKEQKRCMLWGRAAGRCQLCNQPVSWNPQTKEDVNVAEAAHIIGFSVDGPRGEDDLSAELAEELDNLMLMCRGCHKTIDANHAQYPVDQLRRMKRAYEERVERVTAIGQEHGSHILLYGANIGDHHPQVSYRATAPALIIDGRYPASRTPIALSMTNSAFRDHNGDFWRIESQQLQTMIGQQVKPRLRPGDIEHLSIFAIAPQPLLVLLGYLLCDVNYAVRIYQLHREPPGWAWQDHSDTFAYSIERPNCATGQPGLVLALSAPVADDRVTAALGDDAAIWRVTIPQPNNDYLKSARQLQQFRELIRPLMDEIKNHYQPGTPLNVISAAPVSVCVELGRAIQPKAHMPLRLWDQNSELGGFIHALDINLPQGGAR